MYQHSTIEEGMVWEKVILVKVFCEESDVNDVENGEIHSFSSNSESAGES
jgi:hypothetical protein